MISVVDSSRQLIVKHARRDYNVTDSARNDKSVQSKVLKKKQHAMSWHLRLESMLTGP